MNGPLEVLWIASAALAVSSASLTAFGLRQQRTRGWHWWIAALWLTSAGLLLLAGLTGQPAAQAVASVLLVQWPITTLIGLRRFHGRIELPGSERLDWLVLALASTAAVCGALWPADAPLGGVVAPFGMMLAHLYAASLLLGGPDGPEDAPMRLLGGIIGVSGIAPLLALAPWADTLTAVEARAVASTLGAMVMSFIALTLVVERTERQLRDSRRRLRVLANIDALTNVPNRRHFHELASIALLSDAPGSATLLMFDIDHFKRINDHLGHAAGDRALRLVSRSLLEQMRTPDVAGRHGGDEFVMLLRRTTVREAMAVAARIVGCIQEQADAALLPALSLSFGVVQMLDGEALDDAVHRADQALYEAKRQGRSRVVAAVGGEAAPVFTESRRLGLTPC